MALPARIKRDAPRPKREPRPGDSRAHLAWLKTLSCVICGIRADDPHHLLGNLDGLPKGMGRKNEDRWAVPVCRRHHDAAHAAGDDEAWFTGQGIDARALAAGLWRVTGDGDAGDRLIYRARGR